MNLVEIKESYEYCLWHRDENSNFVVPVKHLRTIKMIITFHSQRLKERQSEIESLLSQLPPWLMNLQGDSFRDAVLNQVEGGSYLVTPLHELWLLGVAIGRYDIYHKGQDFKLIEKSKELV
jgi:hypothetical protein